MFGDLQTSRRVRVPLKLGSFFVLGPQLPKATAPRAAPRILGLDRLAGSEALTPARSDNRSCVWFRIVRASLSQNRHVIRGGLISCAQLEVTVFLVYGLALTSSFTRAASETQSGLRSLCAVLAWRLGQSAGDVN